MNDTIGLVYDPDSAALFMSKKTGISPDDVSKFAKSADRYLLGYGIISEEPDDAELYGATAPSIRASHPDLFPADGMRRRHLVPAIQLEFVKRDTDLDGETIARLQDAEDEYMLACGIMHAEPI